MESHIGADLLHELMPSTFKADLEELVPSPSPPCLLTAIGAGGLAADFFKTYFFFELMYQTTEEIHTY